MNIYVDERKRKLEHRSNEIIRWYFNALTVQIIVNASLMAFLVNLNYKPVSCISKKKKANPFYNVLSNDFMT